MPAKTVLARGIQAVTLLFAAFGGAMTKMAPPETTVPGIAVGVASLLSLLVLLSVAAASRAWAPAAKARFRRALALIVAVTCIAGVIAAKLYLDDRERLILGYPPESPEVLYVRGTVLTRTAEEYQKANPGTTEKDLVPKFGGYQNRELVWTAKSIHSAKSRLSTGYFGFVLAVSLCLFCASEMLVDEKKPKVSRKPAKEKKGGNPKSEN
jgi:hypothetical protein